MNSEKYKSIINQYLSDFHAGKLDGDDNIDNSFMELAADNSTEVKEVLDVAEYNDYKRQSV